VIPTNRRQLLKKDGGHNGVTALGLVRPGGGGSSITLIFKSKQKPAGSGDEDD